MKHVLWFLVFILSGSAGARVLELGAFDQEKLAELLRRLPEAATEKTTTPFGPDLVSKLVFPKDRGPFRLECDSVFVSGSPVPSEVACVVELFDGHPKLTVKNDVTRIVVEDPGPVRALARAIPFGLERKKFYSYGRRPGIGTTGKRATIFDYQFICGGESCRINFSNLTVDPGSL
jgi:hypothetical protein